MLRRLGLRSTHLQLASPRPVALCTGLRIRAKTVDPGERGNAERRVIGRDRRDVAEPVWGWSYQTLEGHLEQGRLSYEVIKDLASGEVVFGVSGCSRRAPAPGPLVRRGFLLPGRRTQQRFCQAIQRRLRGSGAGRPPRPAGAHGAPGRPGDRPVRRNALPAERLARAWHPARKPAACAG